MDEAATTDGLAIDGSRGADAGRRSGPDDVDDGVPTVARKEFSAHPTSWRAAQRFAADVLDRLPLGRQIAETALIVTTELVSNAMVHAGTRIELCLSFWEGVLRIEVHDASSVVPLRCLRGSSLDTGRGLSLVESLATRWGIEPEPGGKDVWVEIDLAA